mgnify:CR=1 FL=1
MIKRLRSYTTPLISESLTDMTEYTAYYNSKQVKRVSCKTREEAVKKIKRWYYGRIKKGDLSGKARLVLSVSDPKKECKYSPSFDTMTDGNNYLLKKDLKRLVSESNGHLKLISEEELEKRKNKMGQLKQLERVKRDRTDDLTRALNIVPHLFTNNKGKLFYRVTTQVQKRVGTKWRKGKGSPRTSLKPRLEVVNGSKVWASDAILEDPLFEKKGLVTQEHKSKLILLNSKSIQGAAKEDEIKNAKQRAAEVDFAFRAVMKFRKVAEIFSGSWMSRVKMVHDLKIEGVEYDSQKNMMKYNPIWVLKSDEEYIIRKVRSLIK